MPQACTYARSPFCARAITQAVLQPSGDSVAANNLVHSQRRLHQVLPEVTFTAILPYQSGSSYELLDFQDLVDANTGGAPGTVRAYRC